MKNLTKILILIILSVILMPVGKACLIPERNKDMIRFTSLKLTQAVKLNKIIIPINLKTSIPKDIISASKILSNTTPSKPIPAPKIYPYTKYSVDEIKAKICQVFENECGNALIIAYKESGFSQFAVSKTKDYGIFQINCKWHGRRVGGDCTKYFDIDKNIRIAKQIFDEQGWGPWTTRKYITK